MRKTAPYLTLLVALAAAPAAQADTLGSTTRPANTSAVPCDNTTVYGAYSDTGGTPYLVPSSGGQVTGWQYNTAGGTAGDSLTFFVLRNNHADDSTSVIAADTVTLPNPLPASGVASFTLPAPVAVQGGDSFGLYTSGTGGAACYFFDNTGSTSIPASNTIDAWPVASTPTVGQTLTTGPGPSPSGFEMNLAVTFTPSPVDAGVTTSVLPAGGTGTGNLAVLSSVVTNHGPGLAPITFTDTVPAGLSIKLVLASPGTCTTAGQHVTCTFSGLSVNQQANVAVVVSGVGAGKYTNQVNIAATGVTDPVASNNTASAVLTLTAPPKPAIRHCVVPRLKGTPSGTAKRVLGLLGCKIGKVTTSHNRLAKGLVIGTNPGAGTYALNRKIAITVSSGPKPKRKHRKH